jgi:hypothetical protein
VERIAYDPAMFDWGEIKQAWLTMRWWDACILFAAGFVGGCFVASMYYSERIAVLEARLAYQIEINQHELTAKQLSALTDALQGKPGETVILTGDTAQPAFQQIKGVFVLQGWNVVSDGYQQTWPTNGVGVLTLQPEASDKIRDALSDAGIKYQAVGKF